MMYRRRVFDRTSASPGIVLPGRPAVVVTKRVVAAVTVPVDFGSDGIPFPDFEGDTAGGATVVDTVTVGTGVLLAVQR